MDIESKMVLGLVIFGILLLVLDRYLKRQAQQIQDRRTQENARRGKELTPFEREQIEYMVKKL